MEINFSEDSIKNTKVKMFIEKIPEEIKQKCKFRKIESGKIVVLKGNEIEQVYINCNGTMQVKNEFENGFTYSFASINPIAYIGVMELMANKRVYSSTLQATTECTILEFDKDDFLNWIVKDHNLTLEVLRFVSRSMYEQSLKTGEGFAYPSICTLISYLISIYESEETEAVFLDKSREEIGSILGFSVRTINRNLKILKDENIVAVNRKGILITEDSFYKLWEKLQTYK